MSNATLSKMDTHSTSTTEHGSVVRSDDFSSQELQDIKKNVEISKSQFKDGQSTRVKAQDNKTFLQGLGF